MDRGDFLHLQHVAGKEGGNEQGEGDEDAPSSKELLLALCIVSDNVSIRAYL
jgi:hypothetical protein